MKNLQWRDLKFNQAIHEYKAATKKDMVYVLNRALRNVGFKTAKATPKENPKDIEDGLRKDQIGLKIATKQLRGRIGKTYTTRKGKTRTIRRVTRKQIAKRARELISKRKKRVGFLRQGWIAAMIAAGIKGVRKGEDALKSSRSKIGSGRQATPQRLNAYLGNAAWGRLKGKTKNQTGARMKAALTKGMRDTREDMVQHAQSEMAKTAAKYSARKRSR